MIARQLATALAVCAAAVAARADAPQLRAARASGRIAVDGRLDEADWERAQPFTGFRQVFPGEGAPPSEETEVKVLYDDAAIYVGIRCRDGRPLEIVRPLGRRDSAPASDAVTVLLDTSRDRRSAVLFSLTAGGVQSDALVYDDDRITYEWDASWDGAVEVNADGWTAELAIPLSVARYDPSGGPTVGFGVIRDVARSHEKIATFLLPRSGSGMVTRLGTLGGLDDVAPRADVEVTAYAAQRVALRPKLSDPATPRPRLADAMGDVGVDLRATLGRRLALTATANPDFGQVEADEVILNLTSFEPFFPEKRSFFTEDADAFRPVGAGRETVPQQLFYSRRIGLDAPILGAAKLVGDASDGLRIGVLDALVMGDGQAPGASEDAPDRRLSWSAARPFHLGPADANPLVAPTTQNFLAGVARLRVSDELTVGAQGASAVLLGQQCTRELVHASDSIRPSSCDAQGGNALALDFNAASRDAVWYAYGQVAASRVEGGPPERTLRDGTVLRQGDAGAGTYLRAGKRGGEGFRFDLAWTYAAPRLELNAAGFQRTQNQQELGVTVKYARTDVGPLHELTLVGGGFGQWTTDGRGLSRGRGAAVGFDAQLKDPYLWASCRVRYTDPMYDVREVLRPDPEDGDLEGTGIPFRRPPTEEVTCDLSTDAARAVALDLGGYVGRNVQVGPLGAPGYHGASATVTVRPHPRLETRLSAAYDRNAYPARFLERVGALSGGDEQFLFGALTAPTLSVTLRQLVVLTPRLTFQLYGQLFTAYESWGPLFTATSRGGAIEPSALRSASLAERFDTHTSALVLNAVVRWEYRTGSTLYVVYARNQSELPFASGQAVPHALTPAGLALGPTTDSFLVKWSYRFAR